MHIYEFQAKELLAKHGVAIPRGKIAITADEAATAARDIGGSAWVVKAQIHAGGRGAGRFLDAEDTGGGVRVVRSVEEVRQAAALMLGQHLVTEQTGSGGRQVKRIYIEEACDVRDELYLAILVDRRSSRPTVIASAEGGVKIESSAAKSPDAISKLPVDPVAGLDEAAALQLAGTLGLSDEAAANVARTMGAMYEMFTSLDATLLEINPLGVRANGDVIALDALMTFDDNALFRQPDLNALRDEGELRFGELDTTHHGFNYLKLDGSIGYLASGAGLALATLDAIKHFGGEPASFLDLPPDSKVDQVKDAFEILLTDPGVRCILINVFGGGIMSCDFIADGLLTATRGRDVKIPIIVRLAGTNAKLALDRIKDSGPAGVTVASDMADAAEKAVNLATRATITERRSWWQRMQGVVSGRGETSKGA